MPIPQVKAGGQKEVAREQEDVTKGQEDVTKGQEQVELEEPMEVEEKP